MKPIAPNTLIQNRYLIVHLIGKGGMGEVYLAVDQRLGSAIALKRTFFSDDATLGNAFEREARTLARLRHPVLPKVSDHFTEEGTQYLVMEHISGDDISKRLEGMQKPFPMSWVLFWADQLLDALTYLHTHEPPIIHRDIKPQNLKLTDENHIVLLDFGLSKNSVGETRATTTGSIIGYTPHYASMEQIRGTGTNARSDLYSLSATLYQILTGEVPPDALTRADNLINGMPDPITPISDLNHEVSKGVSDVIIKGMAISQEQRYKTAREMQKALRDAYAQMQTATSAQTVAFNAPGASEIPQSQQKTDVISSLPSVGQAPTPQSPNVPTASDSIAPQTNANAHLSQPPNSVKAEPDFDATIRYDEDIHETSSKQSNIKTEVFLAGSSPAITSAQQESFGREDSFSQPNDYKSQESFPEEESFAEDEDFGQPANYSPDSTVPLFSFDNQTGEAGQARTTSFDSGGRQEENQALTGATVTPTGNYSASEKVSAPPVKQKSSKALAIVGGLAALLILAVSVAGIGWYMLKSKNTVANTTPTPTPEATVSIAPTVEPTFEEAVTNTNNSTNSEIETSNTNASTNQNSVITTTNTPRATQTAGPTPVKIPASKQLTPPVETARPVTNTKKPPVTKTSKGGRTDILQ